MIDITIRVSDNQLNFLSGFFMGQCYSPEREDRKTAIENIGRIYPLLNDEQKEGMEILQSRLEELVNDEELKAQIADLLRSLLENFRGNDRS